MDATNRIFPQPDDDAIETGAYGPIENEAAPVDDAAEVETTPQEFGYVEPLVPLSFIPAPLAESFGSPEAPRTRIRRRYIDEAAPVESQAANGVATKGAALKPNALLDRLIVAGWLNAELLIYIGLVLTAILLRTVDLGSRAMHHDESIHARYSWSLFNGEPCSGGTPCAYDPTFHGPLLYYAVATAYFLFGGPSETTARTAPAIFGIAIVMTCWLLRPLIGRVGALSAAAMITFSTTMLYWSRSLRHDIFATCGEFLFIVALFRFMQSRKNGWLAVSGAGLIIAWASHELTFLTIFITVSYMGIAFLLEVATGPRFGSLLQRRLRPIAGGSQDAADSSGEPVPPETGQDAPPPTDAGDAGGVGRDIPAADMGYPRAAPGGLSGRFLNALILAPALVVLFMSLLGAATGFNILDLTKHPPSGVSTTAAASGPVQLAAAWPASLGGVILNLLLLAAWVGLVLVPWVTRAEIVTRAMRDSRRDSYQYLYGVEPDEGNRAAIDRWTGLLANRRVTAFVCAWLLQIAAFVGQASLFGDDAPFVTINGDPAVLATGAANTIHMPIWPLTLGLRVLFAGILGLGIGVFVADSAAGLGRFARRVAGVIVGLCAVLGLLAGVYLTVKGNSAASAATALAATTAQGYGPNPITITPGGWPVLIFAAFPLAASPGVKLQLTDFVLALFAPHGTPAIVFAPVLAIVLGGIAAVVVAWLFERDMVIYTRRGLYAALASFFSLMTLITLISLRFVGGPAPEPRAPFFVIGGDYPKWIVFIITGVVVAPFVALLIGWLVSLADRYTDEEVAGNGMVRGVLRWCRDPRAITFFLLAFGTGYVLFFSNFFGNLPGLADGFYKGLEVWGKNNDIRRIDEPWFYYSWILSLDDTFVTLVAFIALFAIPITFARRAMRTGAAEFTVRDHFVTFTLYYTVWAMFLYSVAGEKVPWLNLQVALPATLMAAVYLDSFLPRLWQGIRTFTVGVATVAGASVLGLILLGVILSNLFDGHPDNIHNAQGVVLVILALIFFGGVWALNWYMRPPAQRSRGMMGVALVPLIFGGGWLTIAQVQLSDSANISALLTTVILGIVFFVIIGVVMWAAARIGWGMTARTFVGVIFVGAALYTLQESIGLNYNRPDTATDPEIYVQTTPEIPLFMQRLTRMSRDTRGMFQGTQPTATDNPVSNPAVRDPSGSLGLPVWVDQEVAWPLNWYFRDWTDVNYSGKSDQWPIPDKDNHGNQWAVICIKADDDNALVQQTLAPHYTSARIHFRWWFPEDQTGYGGEVTNPDMFVRTFTEKTFRDRFFRYVAYRQLWQPLESYDMVIYVRNDLLPQWAASGGTTDGSNGGTAYNLLDGQGKGRQNGQFNQPRQVTFAPNGDILVLDTGNLRVQRFDSTGKYLSQFGGIGSSNGQFGMTNEAGIGPVGITVDKSGNIYVADTWNHRIEKFDATGKFLLAWGAPYDVQNPGNAAPPAVGFYGPRGVALDAAGNLYVTDTGNKRVQVFDSNGTPIRTFGHYGSGQPDATGDPAFDEPIGIAIDPRTNIVYVADTHNKRVVKVSTAGKYLGAFPVTGWQVQAGDEPYTTIDPQGNLFISDPPNHTVRKFTPDGAVLATYTAGVGSTPGDLVNPLGIAIGPDGTVYVADSGRSAIVTVVQGTAPPQASTTPTQSTTPDQSASPTPTQTEQATPTATQ